MREILYILSHSHFHCDFDYLDIARIRYDENMDILFRITHSGTFNTSVQALMLIFQVCSAKEVKSY